MATVLKQCLKRFYRIFLSKLVLLYVSTHGRRDLFKLPSNTVLRILRKKSNNIGDSCKLVDGACYHLLFKLKNLKI